MWFTLAEQSHIQLQFLKAPFWCSEYATNFGMMNIDFLLFSFTMMTCLRWIYGYMRLEICSKISLSADWCLCTALHTRSGACYYWIGLVVHAAKWMACFFCNEMDGRPLLVWQSARCGGTRWICSVVPSTSDMPRPRRRNLLLTTTWTSRRRITRRSSPASATSENPSTKVQDVCLSLARYSTV